jgi:hypothetical protein
MYFKIDPYTNNYLFLPKPGRGFWVASKGSSVIISHIYAHTQK